MAAQEFEYVWWFLLPVCSRFLVALFVMGFAALFLCVLNTVWVTHGHGPSGGVPTPFGMECPLKVCLWSHVLPRLNKVLAPNGSVSCTVVSFASG